MLLITTVFVSFWVETLTYSSNPPQRSIYNMLTQEDQYKNYAEIFTFNPQARSDLLKKELTVFVPTDTAIEKYEKKKALHVDMAFYHMAEGSWTLNELKTVQSISCINERFPKLWITKTSSSLFVNNAEIIAFKSNNPGKTRNGIDGQDQMLHVIDDVLDAVIKHPQHAPNALGVLQASANWTDMYSVSSFLYKVKEHKLTHLFDIRGSNTYFIPVDRGFDPHKFKSLNKYAVFGHMVPNYVLFTRPTMRELNFETMANNDKIYIVLALIEKDGKMFVKSTTVTGTEENPKGETLVEIVKANIPLVNGVAHLIAEPLGCFKKVMKPFPYLPLIEKLAGDPTLSNMYEMGERTGFNSLFDTHDANFTYFVPNDISWKQMEKKGLSFAEAEADLLKNHLIISQTPYSMENLLALSSENNHVELKTVYGSLKIAVLEISGNFYIRWATTYIKVIRPNYECSDGLIHVIAAPLVNLY